MDRYLEQFSETDNDTIPFRIALGSLIIKEHVQISDRETVVQIRENPYLQDLISTQTATHFITA